MSKDVLNQVADKLKRTATGIDDPELHDAVHNNMSFSRTLRKTLLAR